MNFLKEWWPIFAWYLVYFAMFWGLAPQSSVMLKIFMPAILLIIVLLTLTIVDIHSDRVDRKNR